MERVTFIGGPVDGMQKLYDQTPPKEERFAISSPGFTPLPDGNVSQQFIDARYTRIDISIHPQVPIVMIYEGDLKLSPPDAAKVSDGGILCAHCGRDPATGEEV